MTVVESDHENSDSQLSSNKLIGSPSPVSHRQANIEFLQSNGILQHSSAIGQFLPLATDRYQVVKFSILMESFSGPFYEKAAQNHFTRKGSFIIRAQHRTETNTNSVR